jgi:cell division protein YceG involved in septum cleavage
MLTKKDKQVIVAAAALFLLGQAVIFARIPQDTTAERRLLIVKKGTHLPDVANMLKQEDLIRSSWLFTLLGDRA